MNILSIDGGGIRGIIPARVLQYVEEQTGKQIYELFDLIVGTSTGAILAAGLSVPSDRVKRILKHERRNAYNSAEMIQLFREYGPAIFPLNWKCFIPNIHLLTVSKYPSTGIERSLKTVFGAETSLADALCEILVSSYDMWGETWMQFTRSGTRSIFERKLDPQKQIDGEYEQQIRFQNLLWVVCRASSAAPTYFPPLKYPLSSGKSRALIDGGVACNNPSMIGAGYVLRRIIKEKRLLSSITFLSLGTGYSSASESFELLSRTKGYMWGKLAPQAMMRSSMDISTGVTKSALMFVADDAEYTRLDCDLLEPEMSARQAYLRHGVFGRASGRMDDVSESNLNRLVDVGEAIVDSRKKKLDAICLRLMKKFELPITPTPSP